MSPESYKKEIKELLENNREEFGHMFEKYIMTALEKKKNLQEIEILWSLEDILKGDIIEFFSITNTLGYIHSNKI